MSNASIEAKLARLEELEHRFAEAVERAKLEAMKELAYGAGHEINNPLANIATRAQTLLHEETDPEKRRKLAAINAQAFRAHEMIADLMLFARPPQVRPESVDLQSLLRRIVDELAGEARSACVTMVVHAAEQPIEIHADSTQLLVALKAICTNAIEAMPQGGQIDLRVARSTAGWHAQSKAMGVVGKGQPSSNAVQITIADNGPGIPPEIRPKIFDPFFSGREAGRGLGFGLSKAWRIVTPHGGTIEVRETPGGGATFVVMLACGFANASAGDLAPG
jgi:signal transduction histidine kinase